MFKRLAAVAVAAIALSFTAVPAFAGSPHFVGTPVATVSGDTLTVTGKEAGLGDEDQITVVVTADAQCINGGGNHPQAGNKETFGAGENVPVQNGKAIFSIEVTEDLDCNPPMTVAWSNIVVRDITNGISVTL